MLFILCVEVISDSSLVHPSTLKRRGLEILQVRVFGPNFCQDSVTKDNEQISNRHEAKNETFFSES